MRRVRGGGTKIVNKNETNNNLRRGVIIFLRAKRERLREDGKKTVILCLWVGPLVARGKKKKKKEVQRSPW